MRCCLCAEILMVLVILMIGAPSDSINTNDEKIISNLGDDTHLDCVINTNQTVSQFTWQRKRGQQFTNFFTKLFSSEKHQQFEDNFGGRMSFVGQGDKNGTMELKNVMLDDEGIYKCIFTLFPHGLIEETLSLIVRVAPTVVIEPNPDIPVADSGESIIVTCIAKNAKPAVTIHWDTDFKFSSTQRATPPAANGTVTVSSQLRLSPTREMNGQYVFCVVEHPALKTLDYKLNIHYMSSVTITAVRTEQESFQLKCIADANPSPTKYTWIRENGSFPKSVTVQENGIITVRKMTPDLVGLYVCETQNKVGSAKGFLYLYQEKYEEYHHFMVYISIIVLSIIVIAIIVIAILIFFLYKKKSPTRNDTPAEQAQFVQQLENRSKDQDEAAPNLPD